jgi:hypothetical protein
MFVSGSAMFCMWFFMTLYAQNVLGYSPLDAGLALVPSSLAVVLGSKVAPSVMRTVGARNLAVLGTLIAAAGFGWQSTMTADGSYPISIMFPGILMMLGAGLAGTPLAALATSGAAPGDAGLVSGLVNTSRTMGGSLGLAVMSTIAATRTGGRGSAADAGVRGGVPHERLCAAGGGGADAGVAAADAVPAGVTDQSPGDDVGAARCPLCPGSQSHPC